MPIADEKRAASAIKLHGSLENWALDFIRRHRVSVLPSSEDIKHVLNGGAGSAKGPIEHSDNLFDLSVKSGSAGVSARAKRGGGQARRSKQAKWIGDLGELAVVEHLKAELPKALHGSIRWVAKLGETPGWDVEYLGMDGKLVMVEVKSTTCEGFASFDITENELRAAREHGKQYHLYLVARCNVGKGRRLQVIEDPATVLDKLIRPSVYRVGGG